MLVPWLLVIFGLIFLLENLKLIPAVNWSIVWPVLMVLVGLYMMKKKGGDACCGWFSGKHEEKK